MFCGTERDVGYPAASILGIDGDAATLHRYMGAARRFGTQRAGCDVALAIVITSSALASAWCMIRAEHAAERAEEAAQRIDGMGISHGE